MGKVAIKKEDRAKKFREKKDEIIKPPEDPPIPPKERHRRTQKELLEAKRDDALGKFSDTPNPLFIPIIKAPFKGWADTNKLPDLALKEDEAQELALPVTRLVEYYLPKMPVVGYIWLSLGLSVMAVMSPRMALVSKTKKAKTPEAPLKKTSETPSSDGPASEKFPTPAEMGT